MDGAVDCGDCIWLLCGRSLGTTSALPDTSIIDKLDGWWAYECVGVWVLWVSWDIRLVAGTGTIITATATTPTPTITTAILYQVWICYPPTTYLLTYLPTYLYLLSPWDALGCSGDCSGDCYGDVLCDAHCILPKERKQLNLPTQWCSYPC